MARSTGWRLRRTDLQLAWKGISTNFDKSSVIFEDSTFAALGLIFEQKSGITPDALVNTAHYDITHLTIGKLNLFANLLSNSSRDRFPEKEVEAAVREAYRDGILIENSLEPSMLEKLQQGV